MYSRNWVGLRWTVDDADGADGRLPGPLHRGALAKPRPNWPRPPPARAPPSTSRQQHGKHSFPVNHHDRFLLALRD